MLTGISPSQKVKALLAFHLNRTKYAREGTPTAVRNVDVDHKPRIGRVSAFEGPDLRLRPFVCDFQMGVCAAVFTHTHWASDPNDFLDETEDEVHVSSTYASYYMHQQLEDIAGKGARSV